MTAQGAQIAGSQAGPDAVRESAAAHAWQSVRASADIQFAPLPPMKPPETPGWLEKLGELLSRMLNPLGEALGLSWPVFRVVLAVLAVVLVLFVLWRLLGPLVEAWRLRAPRPDTEWTPPRDAALALLEDADRLADEGRYGEATHLLLQRSVRHIADARPDWLIPASTAREIAALPMLPARARTAFSAIAVRVERSLFALRELTREDWQAARAAYADFALAEFAR